MRTKTLLSTTLLLASAISACDVPPETTETSAPVATAPAAARPGTKPTLIHSEEIGPGHKVEFYRLASGMTGYLETGATTDTLLLRDKKGMDSLAKVFQRVAPTRRIPAALLDADRTAKEVELSQERQAAEAGPPPAPEGGPASGPMMSPAPPADDGISTQQSDLKLYICSDDLLGDSWGRNWWFDNFCYTNRSQYRQCDANLGSFSNNYNIKHFNYTAFEGDFNEKGHTRGMSRLCTWTIFYGWDCWWYADFDFDVAPRTIGTLGYTGSPSWVRVESTSPCGHLGYVAGWD